MVAHARSFLCSACWGVVAVAAALSIGTPPRVAAQSLSVYPKGTSVQQPANASNLTANFSVNGAVTGQGYFLQVICSGQVTGCGSSLGQYTTAPGPSFSVPVNYATTAPGTGRVGVFVYVCQGCSGSDSGWNSVTVLPPYQVAVTPKGITTPERTTGTSGYTAVFTVQNTGYYNDSYNLVCRPSTNVTCTRLSITTSPPLGYGGTATDTAYYNVLGGGYGTLTLSASSGTGARDTGYYNVPVAGATISLAPQNGGTRSVDPFDVMQTVSTPAYQSLQTPRALTLVYNSSTVRPTPVVSVNVNTPLSPYSTTYQLQVQLVSNAAYLTLLNGATSVYYSGTADTTTTRLVASIDAKANNLSTGWYDVNVIVTPYNGSSPGPATTTTTRFLVDDESLSPFGAGWQVAGLQRLNTMQLSYSALITNGDGSMSFFRRDCSTCAFISPAGDPTQLVVYTGPDTGIAYRRAAPDSSATDFRSDGRLVRAWSGELHRPAVIANWSGTQLVSIQDMIGKRLTLGYTPSSKLQAITDPSGRVTTVSIDSAGKLYRATDPDSLTTNFAYDGLLRLTGVTDRAGATTTLTYDTLSRVASTTAPAITDYTGIVRQPITTTTAAERIVWQPATAGTSIGTAKAAVRPDTLAAKVVDPLGNVTRAVYDRFAGVTKIVDPLGQITMIQRDTLGQATAMHTPNGHAGTSTYSGYVLISTYDSTTQQSTTYTYNGYNRVQAVTGNGGATRIDFYYKQAYPGSGDFGPLDSVYVGNTGTHPAPSGGYLAAWHQYNVWGQDSIITDGAGHQTTFLYSDTAHYSNPIQVTDPFSRVVSKAHYDGVGRPDTVWAPSSGSLVRSILTYDQLNRTRTITDPLGLVTQYTFGPITLNRVVDPRGQVYRFDYNALGWLTIQHDLADTTKADTLKYDVGGRVRTIGTRRGNAVSLTYDALSRVLTRSGPDFPVDSFRYDPAGRWTVAVDSNAYDSLAYDVAGRLAYSLEHLTGDSNYAMTLTYDTLGRVTTRSAPRNGSVMTFGYNPGRGTMDTVCAGGQCSVWAGRDADNIPHVLGFAVSNPQHFQLNIYTDSAHRIVSDSFAGPTSYAPQLDTAFSKRWYYDTLGRVTDEWPYGSAYGYGGYLYRYDSDGRMVNACSDHTNYVQPIGVVFSCIDEYGEEVHPLVSSTKPYRYDSTSNRTDSLASAVVGSGNRLTQFKGYALAYDPNGNVISKKGLGGSSPSDTTLFTWDAVSRLTKVERWTGGGAHTIITYAYDALGRRVAKTVGSTTERYVHDGDQVIEDIDGATHALKAEYTWIPGAIDKLLYIRTAGWTAGVITDPLNSTVRGFANLSNGQPMKQYPASYWGEVSPDTGFVVRFRHAGREYDAEAGIYYNRARYYDPQIGRFLSEDPKGIAGGLNLYAYTGNDPINRVDPSGLDCPPDCPVPLDPVVVEGQVTGNCDAVDATSHDSSAEEDCYAREAQCLSAGGSYVINGGYGYCTVSTRQPQRSGGDSNVGAGSSPPAQNLGQQGPSCHDAKLLFALSLVSDIGFFATGGLEGIADLAKAGAFVAKELTRELPRTGRLYIPFAVGELRNAGRALGGAYLGTHGISAAGLAGGNAAGLALTGQKFDLKGFLRSLVPVLGTIDAYKAMQKACAS